ncbi:hypothetical protein ScPMuIL_005690 [Solemya velum]
MGGWKLEVFRMAVYMTFPVGLFYYFNQPEFFEGWMMAQRQQLFPPEDPRVDEIKKAAEELERLREQRWEEQFKDKLS